MSHLMLDANNPDDTADYGRPGPDGIGPDETYCRRCGIIAIDHTPGRYSIHGVCPSLPLPYIALDADSAILFFAKDGAKASFPLPPQVGQILNGVAESAKVQRREAWDAGHRHPWRRDTGDCHCGAWSSIECACGRYGNGALLSLADNPYKAE